MTKYKSITESGSYQQRMADFMQKQIAAYDKDALESLLKSENGRWFLMRLLDETRVNGQTFTGNAQTFYNEGRRSVGVRLLASIAELGVDAVKLKQIAELEYIQFQLKAKELAIEKLKEDEVNE